jgi:hypothetical protein
VSSVLVETTTGRLERRPERPDAGPACRPLSVLPLLGVALTTLMGAAADASSPPTLLVLPIDMVDTSGQTPTRTNRT